MDNRPTGGGGGGGGGGRNNANNSSRSRKSKVRRGGRRRNDNSRRGGGNNKSKNAQRNKGPPSPPQTKIILRNIGDVTKHGSVKCVISLIRTILENANHKLSAATSRTIELDESAVEFLIQEEEAVQREKEKAIEMEKGKAEKKPQDENKESTDEENTDTKQHENDTEQANGGAEEEKSASQPPKKHEKNDKDALHEEASTVNLGARIVYIVPPKQTRRRGIKPGCAYVVISGPRVEAKEPPPKVAPVVSNPPASDPSKEEKKDALSDSTGENVKGGEGVETKGNQSGENPSKESSVASTNGAPGHAAGNHVTIIDPPSAHANSKESSTTPPADYSREVAKGRFLVLQAIEVLVAHTAEDAKTDQVYAGSRVEVALSGKTYKQQLNRRDRREGTLEQSADYKNFLEKVAKDKQDRMARPKPAPGGGATVPATTTTPAPGVESVENGQPIAALVAHIRNKRLEASKRKKAKKKSKDSVNKEKGVNNTGGKSSRKKTGRDGKEEGGKTGGRKKDGKKSKRSGKKKTAKGSGGNSNNPLGSGVPPTLLKPGGPVMPGTPGMMVPPQQQTLALPPGAGVSLPGMNGVMGGFQGYG